jgi:hypothetical protein
MKNLILGNVLLRILETIWRTDMAKKGKRKFKRCCYNCKYRWADCKERFKVEICDRFKFDSICKSM